ncbi:hypothetical protein WS62_29240 [Burkholderia sp. ABCPW 14]|nr:hypothetical protein WS62_29240 [Burkholderia sp. ABCPW 14]
MRTSLAPSKKCGVSSGAFDTCVEPRWHGEAEWDTSGADRSSPAGSLLSSCCDACGQPINERGTVPIGEVLDEPPVLRRYDAA